VEIAALPRYRRSARGARAWWCARRLLLQAHFGRTALPMSDYVSDTKSVLDQALRVLQAMVDVAADGGWLFTALGAMYLAQMVTQGRYPRARLQPSMGPHPSHHGTPPLTPPSDPTVSACAAPTVALREPPLTGQGSPA
jgi:hypothetical protein